MEAWYRTQPEFIQARDEENDAEFEYNILDGAVFAFSQRKTALESLVSLWIGQYFSTPREPKAAKGIQEMANQKVVSKQKKKLRERRKNNAS